jgi:hypothetical protein
MLLSAEEWGEFSLESENLEESELDSEGGANDAVQNRAGRAVYGERKKRSVVVRSGRKASGR